MADAQGGSAAPKTHVVTFYGHLFGHGMGLPMPANTEFPTGEEGYGLGSFDYCGPAEHPAPADDPVGLYSGTCDEDPTNKVVLYSTAGFVDIKTSSEFSERGYELFHNERGQTKAITLDRTKPVTARIFLSLDLHGWAVTNTQDPTYCLVGLPPDVPCPYPYWGWDPGVQPQWIVEATLYKGILGEYGGLANTAPDILTPWQEGRLDIVAQGATPPRDIIDGLPGYPAVNEFVVDLGNPRFDRIEKEEDFVLVFSFYSLLNGEKVSWHSWRIWGGEFFPPIFTLPVKNAFDVELVYPQFIHGKLVILTVINTPWGSYDVDPTSLTATVRDAKQNVVTMESSELVADYSVAHGGHYQPVNATWIWDYKADELPPGRYTVTVSASNFQHSASSTTTAAFTIREDGTPGPVEIGRSGEQTASSEDISEFTRGAERAAGDDGSGDGPEDGPRRDAAGGPAGLLGRLLSFLGLALVERRWGS